MINETFFFKRLVILSPICQCLKKYKSIQYLFTVNIDIMCWLGVSIAFAIDMCLAATDDSCVGALGCIQYNYFLGNRYSELICFTVS